MLGLIVSGRPAQTFNLVEGTTNRFATAINDVDNVNHIVVFLTEPLPEGFGAGVHFSWPSTDGSSQWTYLGYLSNVKPSAIYKIIKPKQIQNGGPGGDASSNSMVSFAMASHQAGVGISVEPIDNLKMLSAPVPETSQKSTLEQYCGKMLENFVNYVSSFAISNPSNPSDVYVPMKNINSWFENFRRKLETDPNFWKS